ncbi:MAG TPA: hypothetical protein VK501_21880 [Baekduia sp.]|uniref:hypothetical protein n=1 Tax=Baekduia sp. TaxID=2600305 RepID=UPI002B9A586A|nr:hypothetical protein [Baekduia sp.]HMJ36570.1 hypothetical protein [Baekduia sp.]
MRLSLKRLAPVTVVTVVAAAGVLIPAAGASGAPALVPVPSLPAFSWPAAGFGGLTPQVAIGPTVVGDVFNGGTAVVVSSDPPVGSGNVIGSP